jgi:copper chaperone
MTTSATYIVSGMTCGHCVTAVTQEVAALDGVTTVAIDLVPGGDSRVTVSGSAPPPAQDVAAAVREAGYDLAGVHR